MSSEASKLALLTKTRFKRLIDAVNDCGEDRGIIGCEGKREMGELGDQVAPASKISSSNSLR